MTENKVYSSGVTYRKWMRLKDMSTARETGEKGETEQGHQPDVHKKRTPTGKQPIQTQPFLLVADVPFPATLDTVPTEDWYRTWTSDRS